MEKILKQATELVTSLQEEKARECKLTDELEAKIDSTSKLMTRLENQKRDLDAREEEIKKQEAPSVLLMAANKAQAESREALTAIDTAQKSFAKERAEFNSKVAKDRAEIQGSKDLLAKELEVLKADRKDLEAKKLTYKDDVLNKLKAVK